MKNLQVVIASVPWTDTTTLIMAPGALKGALSEYGIDSIAIDLNQEVRQRINDSPVRNQIIHFFITSEVKPEAKKEIYNLFNWMADRITSYNTPWIALSLLTYISQPSCRWLCFLIKQRNPNVKITIGGAGCFGSLKGVDTFAGQLKRLGLIDYFVSGDGEKALPELITGNVEYPGINSVAWKELENLDQLPFPDYSDYNFDLYSVNSVLIWGSRGCVRECTFCDIHEHWEKFQWRSAESIFEEIKTQYELYGIDIFNFSDSLINGNQKEYRKLIKLLADFNNQQPLEKQIKWTSFFIFRPKNQMTEDDWQLTKESGAMLLMVGVESFSDPVREHLKKKFNNEDLEHNLSMAKKYGVKLALLIIIGYVTETEHDHQLQLNWLKNNQHYANDPIVNISIGSTMSVLPGTWVYQHQDDLGIKLNSDTIFQDWTVEKINSTPDIRLQRHREFLEACKENKFECSYMSDNHMLLEAYVNANQS